jgi:5-dehydro-4-deoxyglucarate dehydratase
MMGERFQPDELAQMLRTGLMCFPVTDFDAGNRFNRKSFAARLEWQLNYEPRCVFAAGGAGEFFSLTFQEYAAVVGDTVEVTAGRAPVIASAGYGTEMAIEFTQRAELLGADAILLLPPYLTEAPQDGLVAHVNAVCRATNLGVVVYSRANCVLNAHSIATLAAANPNFIAVKDGHGDAEEVHRIRATVGDRITLINGMPTAETYAPGYFGMGVTSYSSAIFNFLPRTAMAFYASIAANDATAVAAFNHDFLVPYCEIRRRRPGYAVSIVKAGLDIIERSAGPVRSPLSDLNPAERDQLRVLIEQAGPQ